MLEAKFQPVTHWPRKPTGQRKHATYRASYKQTLALLEKELRAVGARNIIIEAFFTSQQIRNDGWPRSDARPSQPGVVVRFETERGPMVFPSDKYTDWEDNLRAIGLTLESLRAVERHGATYDGEQYRGWKALPESTDGDAVKRAAGLLLRESGHHAMRINRDDFEGAWKAAVMNTHPDRGGSAERFNAVIAARDLIRERLGW